MKLKDYMKQTETIYKEAAPEFIKAAKEAKAIRDEIIATRASADLTPEGKTKRIAALNEKMNAIQANMEAIRRTANEKAADLRGTVESVFYNYYHATPAAVDLAGIELLKSGILSDRELAQFAQSYTGNATMRRVCAQYMQKTNNPELQRMASVIQQESRTNPHLACMDSIISVGNYTLGGGASGPDFAEKFLERFDEMTAQTYAAAPDIEA